VDGVKGGALLAPVARVAGDHLCPAGDGHLFDPTDDAHLMVGKRSRHRIVVAVETHEGERVGVTLGDPSGLEGLGRQRQHGRAVVFEAFGLGADLAPDPAEQVGITGGRQVLVQRGPRREGLDRDQQVAPGVADVVLDMALLVAPADPAEMIG
jgi:hypothetical protein